MTDKELRALFAGLTTQATAQTAAITSIKAAVDDLRGDTATQFAANAERATEMEAQLATLKMVVDDLLTRRTAAAPAAAAPGPATTSADIRAILAAGKEVVIRPPAKDIMTREDYLETIASTLANFQHGGPVPLRKTDISSNHAVPCLVTFKDSFDAQAALSHLRNTRNITRLRANPSYTPAEQDHARQISRPVQDLLRPKGYHMMEEFNILVIWVPDDPRRRSVRLDTSIFSPTDRPTKVEDARLGPYLAQLPDPRPDRRGPTSPRAAAAPPPPPQQAQQPATQQPPAPAPAQDPTQQAQQAPAQQAPAWQAPIQQREAASGGPSRLAGVTTRARSFLTVVQSPEKPTTQREGRASRSRSPVLGGAPRQGQDVAMQLVRAVGAAFPPPPAPAAAAGPAVA
jgi:hypothetical protein